MKGIKEGKRKDETGSPQKRKVSEMVHEFARDFIRLGESREQRQYRLNAACAAWNIACEPPDQRDKFLYKFLKEYARHNQAMNDEEIASVCGDMEKLIEVRLTLFPDVQIKILDAKIIPTGKKERLEVVSLRFGDE